MVTIREPGTPGEESITRDELAQMIGEVLKRRRGSNEADDIGKEFTPAVRGWKIVGWGLGILSGGALTIFGIGVAYEQAIGDNATKGDLSIHRATDFVPLESEVAAFKQEMEPIKQGVQTLVDDRNLNHEVKKAKRKLQRYDENYAEALQEYRKNKRAGRRAGRRPRKSSDHLDLEQLIQDLEEQR